MKVCFALLVDHKIHNYARKLAFDIDKKYNTGVIAARLPQHVTLGPVFEVEDIEDVEEYFDSIAGRIKPFKVMFTNIDLKVFGDEDDGLGVLWMNIRESHELRKLHSRIYKHIKERLWKADNVPGDGIYDFHSTISLGEQPAKVYKEIYDNIHNRDINYTCLVNDIAMFCTTDSESKMGTYITYKILPLGDE